MTSDDQEMRSEDEKSQTKLIESLMNSFDQKLDIFSLDPSNSYAACIYKVSDKPRKENVTAYTPRLVSIGPLHRDRDRVQLQGMEAYKLKSMHKFLSRFGIGLHTLIKFAARKESFVRGCYEGKINLSRKRLSELILLDGIFIVELFLKNYFVQLRDINDTIFKHQWMYDALLHDMMLLENQLPISIMESLLSFVNLSLISEDKELTIHHLAHKFFENVGNTHKVPLTTRCYKARHFVEFLLFLHGPPVPSLDVRQKASPDHKFENSRSVTELQEAGVKFYSGEEDSLFEFHFDKETGELTIPKLTVNASTLTFFQNLVAYEQFGLFGYSSKYITSYVILMHSFIETSGDVDILVSHRIIDNKLGDSQQVANLFNNLYKEAVIEAEEFYFVELCENLNNYHKDWLHQWRVKCFKWRVKWPVWMVVLRRDYFRNPWTFLSVLAAFVLLILTVIQTVCSILQVR